MGARGRGDGGAANIYRETHKALRHTLVAMLDAAGTATAHRDSLAALRARWDEVSTLLTLHRRRTTRWIEPLLAEPRSDDQRRMAGWSEVTERTAAGLDAAFRRLVDAPLAEQWCLLEQVYLDLADHVAGVLQQLRLEDEILCSLRAALDPIVVEELRDRLHHDLSHDEVVLLLRSMIPALNIVERIDVLSELRDRAATTDFEVYRAVIEGCLPAQEYRDLTHALGWR